jgi:hypothetical protein
MTPVYPKGRFQYCGNITDKTSTWVESSGVAFAFAVVGVAVTLIAAGQALLQQLF